MGASEKTPRKILIMAGGTGGHVMPALAVAQYLFEKGIVIHWLGTRAGIEARLVPQAGFPLSYIEIQGLRRSKTHWLLAPWRISKAILQAIKIILQEKPDVVLSMGGYVAGPGAIAAWLLRKPVVLHEQNAISGWTNRIISKFAKRVMVAFPNVFSEIAYKVVTTGNPVRKEILLAKGLSCEALAKQEEGKRLNLLILGGSQGALIFNEIVPQALALIPAEKRPTVLHQTGKQHLALTKANYVKYDIQAEVFEFIEDMGQAYEKADMVICRSGALTVAEISVVGIPSIFIPFPYAVDDHQTANAKYLSDHGAAFLLPQTALTPQALHHLLMELIDNPAKRLAMSAACLQKAMPQATMTVAQNCLEVSCGS